MTNSVTFEGAYDGKSGLAVAPGAEVVIYVRENCTLRASGTNAAQGGPGGGAGILCPAGSTLVVTGPGAVRAVGGDASDGEVCGRAIGGAFVDGDGDGEIDTSRGGKGGDGGGGAGAGAGAGIGGAGAGAGAGIGGAGGKGGKGGKCCDRSRRSALWKDARCGAWRLSSSATGSVTERQRRHC